MTIIVQAHNAIAAVCPIHGISFGRPADKATWRIDFDDAATPEQRAAAQAVLEGYDLARDQHNAPIDAQIAALEAAKPGYVRGIREFILAMAAIVKADGGPDLMQNVGMQNVKALDDAVKALRSQRQ